MTEPLPWSIPPRRPSRARAVLPWVLYLMTLVSAFPLGAAIAAGSPQPEGACSGIGFGCSLYGEDLAEFVLAFVGLPYALALALVLTLLGFGSGRVRTAQVVVATVGLAIPWLAVLALTAGPPPS